MNHHGNRLDSFWKLHGCIIDCIDGASTLSQPLNIESGVLAKAMAVVLEAGFLNQGFINSMRFSELNGDEEYDNTFLYITWHALASGGMQQVREQVADLERLKRTPEQYMQQTEASRERIEDFLTKAKKYQYDKPIDDVDNIKVMNNELADYNENLMDATDL